MKISNYIKNINDIMRQNTVLEAKPLFWTAVLTWDCNLKCKMCLLNQADKNLDMINKETVLSFLDNNQQLVAVEWSGGEPALHPNFEEFLDKAQSFSIKQSLITNATLLTESIIKKLVEYNVYVTVSLDAPVKDVYENIRQGANFETVIKNIRLFNKYKKEINNNFKLNIDYVVLQDNYRYMPETVGFVKSLGAVRIFFMSDLANTKYALSAEHKETFKNILAQTKAEGKKYNIEVAIDSELEDFANVAEHKEAVLKKAPCACACIAPWQSFCTHSDGSAFPTLFCDVSIGNIKDGDIWNGKAMQKYRQNMLNLDFSLCDACKNVPPLTKSYRSLDRFLKIMLASQFS